MHTVLLLTQLIFAKMQKIHGLVKLISHVVPNLLVCLSFFSWNLLMVILEDRKDGYTHFS